MLKIIIKENKTQPSIDKNFIIQTVGSFINKKLIQSIYHYGSSYTGQYGKTHKDTWGDIDIAIVYPEQIDEDEWFSSREYEILKDQDYDIMIVSNKDEIPDPKKII